MALKWEELIIVPLREMLTKFASFIPTLLGALIILIVGWIIAKLIEGLANKILQLIKFDKIAEKAGISSVLEKGNISLTASQLLSVLAYWLVMIIVLVMSVNALGLTIASSLLERIFVFIPNVIAAVFILVLGLFLGAIVAGTVRAAAQNANLPGPRFLSGVSRWAIVIFAVTVSLGELGIAPMFLATTFNIFFGAVCLALAIAFGLGGKDMAAKYLEELKKRSAK